MFLRIHIVQTNMLYVLMYDEHIKYDAFKVLLVKINYIFIIPKTIRQFRQTWVSLYLALYIKLFKVTNNAVLLKGTKAALLNYLLQHNRDSCEHKGITINFALHLFITIRHANPSATHSLYANFCSAEFCRIISFLKLQREDMKIT